MALIEEIRALAAENTIDYLGIASIDRFEHAPRGHRPRDILYGAESVVSMGVRMNVGPQLTQRIALADNRLKHIAYSYRWFAYGLINMYLLDRAAFLLTRLLEAQGDVAVPIVASGVENNRELMALFSNRHAAAAAGLGDIGWNGLCLTPDNGPRQRFVSVITTAELEPTPLRQGSNVCNLKKCKELGQGQPVCMKLCPVNAFSREKRVEAKVNEREFVYAWMDHHLCALAGTGLHPLILGPKDMEMPKEATFEARTKLRTKAPARSVLEAMVYGRGHFCGICLLRCPVGAPKAIDDIMKSRGEVT